MGDMAAEDSSDDETQKTPSQLRYSLSSQMQSHSKESSPVAPRKLARLNTSLFSRSTLDASFGTRLRPTLILGLLYFNKPLDIEHIRNLLRDRLVAVFPRFRSRVVLEKSKTYFIEQPLETIDMKCHVRSEASSGWTQQDIDAFLSKCYQENKPTALPLWRFHVLNDLKDGRSLLVANIDHCIGDGITMVEVLLSILDDPAPDAHQPATQQRVQKRSKSSSLSLIARALIFFIGVMRGLLALLLPHDAPNSLKTPDHRHPGTQKACAFGARISLSQVKEIKDKLPGTTVNDVLTATLNMALRRYYEEVQDNIIHTTGRISASFPINTRNKHATIHNSFGNKFATGSFTMHLNYASRTELVWRVKEQVDVIKASPQPYVEKWLASILTPLLPPDLLINVLLDIFGRNTLMISNVPGPQSISYLGGQPIDDLCFIAAAPIGMYCGLVSYNGQVALGVCCDTTGEKHPERVTKYWKQEFDALYAEVMSASDDALQPRAQDWMSAIFRTLFRGTVRVHPTKCD